MRLEGSCHCRAVRFSVQSAHPCPYQRCYCSICRKTAGAGGFAINIGADARTLKVDGEDALGLYRARLEDGSTSSAERRFCTRCGSALWLYDPRWPDLVHPHASAIDTPLPLPPARTHILTASRSPWVNVDAAPSDRCHDGYPDESLAAWHRRMGLER